MRHNVSPENAVKFLDWIKTRDGVAIWKSINFSNLDASWSAPVRDPEGKVNGKPSWQCDNEPARIITDASDVDVVEPLEHKRFHVATYNASMSIKVSDGGTRRIRKEVDKASEEFGDAWYEFDYGDYKNAVILVPGETTPLDKWEELNAKPA